MSSIRFFNTLTMKKEPFTPLGDTVLLYACGPTVYNLFHIGNARMLVVFDTLRRYLAYRGLPVLYARNFTDVDDKIIRKAQEEGVDAQAVAEKYIREFYTDADGLNLLRPDFEPRATENIDGMIEMIAALIEKNHAYAVNGDVYFKTRSFAEYGKLSHQNVDDLESGARIEVGDTKQDPLDFALWKAAKPGEPSWSSPWGNGRPGWHIECSVMAGRYLGATIDIHGGGQDLVFPHHENEIAQSECANGVPFARFWLHNAYINIDGQKMSKSGGNFFVTRDVAARYGYEAIRFFLLSAHYRSPVNYSVDVMDAARASLQRITTCRGNLAFLLSGDAEMSACPPEDAAALDGYKAQFIQAMDDDLNTADGLAAVFDLVRYANTRAADAETPRAVLAACAGLLDELCGVIGLRIPQESGAAEDEAEIQELVAQRTAARAARNFAEADRIRDLLKVRGITLEDTPGGVKIIRQ